MPLVALFMVINVIIGCYVMIRLGYGPPHWVIALNLVIRVTTFQDCLNAGRDWLEQKAPWTTKLFLRLHIPKPIILVDILGEEEGVVNEAEKADAEDANAEKADAEDANKAEDESAAKPSDVVEDNLPEKTDS